MKMMKKPFRWLYIATFIFFLLYITVISDSNFAKHKELNRQIENLEAQIARTRNHIYNKHDFNDLVNDPVLLEQYAREQMDMHKSGEDVFIMVYE